MPWGQWREGLRKLMNGKASLKSFPITSASQPSSSAEQWHFMNAFSSSLKNSQSRS